MYTAPHHPSTDDVSWPLTERNPRLEEVLSPAQMGVFWEHVCSKPVTPSTPSRELQSAALQMSIRGDQRLRDTLVLRGRTQSSVRIGKKCKQILKLLAPRPHLGDEILEVADPRGRKGSILRTASCSSAKIGPRDSTSPLYFGVDEEVQWDTTTLEADREDPFGSPLSNQDYESGPRELENEYVAGSDFHSKVVEAHQKLAARGTLKAEDSLVHRRPT
ncbi:hypothetical protein B0H15DRAFT_851925 [Mycena belliarum]|uniref:Uncharacterized protein n=1 Tax=Mycena belliarum TaxID=1033014 RepID=A0AAD6U2V6_9AGAR|nr:hypothetical protein B0H15DRAFT_851925 [Mycena belliae]